MNDPEVMERITYALEQIARRLENILDLMDERW